MTTLHIEKAACKLATGMNGGGWDTHYTERHKQVWRDRVKHIWGASQ